MTMNKRYVLYALAVIMFAGCQTKNVTETERFDASVRKELPFAVDSLRWLDGVDMATYQFACRDYVATPPDAFIGLDGALNVYNNFLFENRWSSESHSARTNGRVVTEVDEVKPTRQTEDVVWRNVVMSKKNQRIICIDRYLAVVRRPEMDSQGHLTRVSARD